jgi:hypothetical protein
MDTLYYTPEDIDENDELVEDLDGLTILEDMDIIEYYEDED